MRINLSRKFFAEKDFHQLGNKCRIADFLTEAFLPADQTIIQEDQHRNQDQANKIFGMLKMQEQLLMINF